MQAFDRLRMPRHSEVYFTIYSRYIQASCRVIMSSGGPFHEQLYTFVYTIDDKSNFRRTIVLPYKGNQSKFTNIGQYTTVHETETR